MSPHNFKVWLGAAGLNGLLGMWDTQTNLSPSRARTHFSCTRDHKAQMLVQRGDVDICKIDLVKARILNAHLPDLDEQAWHGGISTFTFVFSSSFFVSLWQGASINAGARDLFWGETGAEWVVWNDSLYQEKHLWRWIANCSERCLASVWYVLETPIDLQTRRESLISWDLWTTFPDIREIQSKLMMIEASRDCQKSGNVNDKLFDFDWKEWGRAWWISTLEGVVAGSQTSAGERGEVKRGDRISS